MVSPVPATNEVQFATPRGDERQRIIRMRTALIMGSPFFGLLAYRMKLIDQEAIGTAGTDGKTLLYNPAFISAQNDSQLKGLLGHEVMHITQGHAWRRGTRHPRLWNVACDFAIDPILKRSGFELPSGEHINPKWAGWSAEQIYAELLQQVEEEQKKSGGSMDDAIDKLFGKGPSAGQVLDAPQATAIQDQADWKQAISAAAQVAKSQGKLPSDLEEMVEEALAPRVDWKSVLRRFVQMCSSLDYNWQAPSKRHLASNLYLPRLRSEQMPPVVIAFDTSGSIGAEELKQFFGECDSILEEARPESIWLLQCDAHVHSAEEYLPGDPIKRKVVGRGGTSFKPVFKWVEEHDVEPACLIYLTDLYGDFPDEVPPYPVIWASTTKPEDAGQYTPPFGEVVHLDFE